MPYASLHADLDSHENDEDTNDLVEQHVFGSFFTMVDIWIITEHIFSELRICILPPFHSPIFNSDAKETSCVVNLSPYFSIANTEQGFPTNNETLRVTLMVMLGSRCPILSLPSKEMEEEIMKKYEEIYHVPENMTTTSGMDQIQSTLSINNEHEYVLDNFLCSYFLVEQDMNVD
jgi:hypothetical protein